jgi:tRNA (guanine-N7-)-methyltransferase
LKVLSRLGLASLEISMPLKHFDVFYDPTGIEDRGINPYLAAVRQLAAGSDRVLFGERLRDKRGMWRTKVFAGVEESTPLVLEIGSYKGATLTHFAKTFPNACWVGMDITFKRVALVGQKLDQQSLSNAAVVMARASSQALPEIFSAAELTGVMVFYPDPWTRLNQRHNRLVTEDFLASIIPLIRTGGFFWFKSDQGDYFDEVKGFCEKLGLQPLASASELPLFTPHQTPFEQRFQRLGDPAWEGCWVKVDG